MHPVFKKSSSIRTEKEDCSGGYIQILKTFERERGSIRDRSKLQNKVERVTDFNKYGPRKRLQNSQTSIASNGERFLLRIANLILFFLHKARTDYLTAVYFFLEYIACQPMLKEVHIRLVSMRRLQHYNRERSQCCLVGG